MRLRPCSWLLMLAAVLALWCTPACAEAPGAAFWDRGAALEAARSVDTFPTRQSLFERTVAGSAMDTVDLLEATLARDDWPVPAREWAVFEYVQDLRTLPAASVPVEVMKYLRAYDARTLVPHEDHPRGSVALFNIRGAAAGVENEWQRREAVLEGQALMAADPAGLVDAFALEAHPAVKGGFLDALSNANTGPVRAVARIAARRLPHDPGLTALAGRAAVLSRDAHALQVVLLHGEGAALAPVLREAVASLDESEVSELLLVTLDSAPTSNAALAIAELTPAVAMDAAVQARLLSALGDRVLGAAAALALGRAPTPETLGQLEELAAGDDALAAARARFALGLRHERAIP